jgi:glycosyltransferase involved in cell wall biosynthesis
MRQAILLSMKTSADSQRLAGLPLHEGIEVRTRDVPGRSAPAAAIDPAQSVVLIVEPDFTGHRWRYAQWAAQAFAEAGQRCVIATTSANAHHPLAQSIASERLPGIALALIDERPPSSLRTAYVERIPYVRSHRYFAQAYQSVSARTSISFVLVPYIDYFLYALPFLGSPFNDTPWIGITMRTTFHHRHVGVNTPDRPLINTIKATLFQRTLRTPGLRTLLSIDPTLTQWSGQASARAQSGASIAYLADPFPTSRAADPAQARSRLKLRPGPHLLVYGSITERKGIRELVLALEAMASAPTLVVAGQQDEATRAFLRTHAPRLTPAPVLIDRFIDSETELDLFSACEVLWLGYKGHYGMSGVLVQAYRFGKRVIATSEGLIGWFCAEDAFGPVLDDLSPPSIAAAVDRAFAPQRSVDTPKAGPRGSLLEHHTLDAFKRTLRDAATARAG